MSLFTRHRESTGETAEETLARLDAAGHTVKPEGPRGLAAISRRHWREVCVAVWVLWALDASTLDPNWTIVVALVVQVVFMEVAVSRTQKTPNSERTTVQRAVLWLRNNRPKAG